MTDSDIQSLKDLMSYYDFMGALRALKSKHPVDLGVKSINVNVPTGRPGCLQHHKSGMVWDPARVNVVDVTINVKKTNSSEQLLLLSNCLDLIRRHAEKPATLDENIVMIFSDMLIGLLQLPGGVVR